MRLTLSQVLGVHEACLVPRCWVCMRLALFPGAGCA